MQATSRRHPQSTSYARPRGAGPTTPPLAASLPTVGRRSPKPPRRTRAAPAPRTAGESATCRVSMWGVAHVSRCESSLCAERPGRCRWSREVFSLVCCLLRLVSLFRESSLLNEPQRHRAHTHTRQWTVDTQITLHTAEGKSKRRRCALFRLSVTGFVVCVCCVCVPIDNPFSTYRFRRDSAPWWWLEAVCRHACVCQSGGPLLSEP